MNPIIHSPIFYERRTSNGPLFMIRCPGCQRLHYIPGNGGWKWNGNKEKPTLTPSVALTDCHFSIVEGMLHYDASSRHGLRGLVVPMERVGAE